MGQGRASPRRPDAMILRAAATSNADGRDAAAGGGDCSDQIVRGPVGSRARSTSTLAERGAEVLGVRGEGLGQGTLVDPAPGGLDQVRDEERAGRRRCRAERMTDDVRVVVQRPGTTTPRAPARPA